MIRPTGLIQDRHESRVRDDSECRFECPAEFGAGSSVQPIAWIRDQPKFPDCVGESTAAWIEAYNLDGTRVSAVSIWREARRRQGRIEEIERGTRLEYAMEGLVARGWDLYRPGEELDDVEAGRGAVPAGDDFDDELDAYDNLMTLERSRIIGAAADVLDATELAVRAGRGVFIGTGLRAPFFDYRGDPTKDDAILSSHYFGGTANGHAMRVFAVFYRNGVRCFGLQNSHGVGWGGIHLEDDSWQPGCCIASESVIVGAWDRHSVRRLK